MNVFKERASLIIQVLPNSKPYICRWLFFIIATPPFHHRQESIVITVPAHEVDSNCFQRVNINYVNYACTLHLYFKNQTCCPERLFKREDLLRKIHTKYWFLYCADRHVHVHTHNLCTCTDSVELVLAPGTTIKWYIVIFQYQL